MKEFLVTGLITVPAVVCLWMLVFWIGGEFSR